MRFLVLSGLAKVWRYCFWHISKSQNIYLHINICHIKDLDHQSLGTQTNKYIDSVEIKIFTFFLAKYPSKRNIFKYCYSSLEFFFFVHMVSTFHVLEILHSPYRAMTRRLFHHFCSRKIPDGFSHNISYRSNKLEKTHGRLSKFYNN